MSDTEDVASELAELHERLKNAAVANHNELSVTHKTEGMGKWGPAAIVACFASMLLALGSAILLSRDNDKLARRIETLEAWMGVNNNLLSELKSDLKHLEGKP